MALAACSGSKAKAVDDARRPLPAGDAAPRDAAIVKVDPDAKGDVQIKVEWKNVPAVARAAPGRTACNTPRPPAVSPTTLWGIPEVFVAVEGFSIPAKPKRIVLGDCALSPRVVSAGETLTIASAADAPAKLGLARMGPLPLGGDLKEEKGRDIFLPVAGHEVQVALEPGIYRLSEPGGAEAWIVRGDVAVTEGAGMVVLRDVPAGASATAWLPPRSGQPARTGKAPIAHGAGAITDVTVDISSP